MDKFEAVSRRAFMESAALTAGIVSPKMRSMGQTHRLEGEGMTKLMPYLLFDGNLRRRWSSISRPLVEN